jgi:murein L,D-transpeptidase YafK
MGGEYYFYMSTSKIFDKVNAGFIPFCIIISVLLSAIFLSCTDSREDLVRNAFRDFKGSYVLYVNKAEFSLYIYDRNCRVVSRYQIAYGLNPDKETKLFAGDNRTPEGKYRIIEILSMDANKASNSYKKIRAMNRIFFRARDGHYKYGKRQEDLGENAYGSRFFLIDYPNQRDRERYERAISRGEVPRKNGKFLPIGFGIAIHGNCDPPSIGHLATSGCIRMFNEDIVELDNYIQLGTPVIISKE